MSGQNCCISNLVISSASSSLGICLPLCKPSKKLCISSFAGTFPSLCNCSKKAFSSSVSGNERRLNVLSNIRSCVSLGFTPGYGVLPVYMPKVGRLTSLPQDFLKDFINFFSLSPIKRLKREIWSDTKAFIGYITITRTPRIFQANLFSLASIANFAISGHIKHSVLPEPVPVATNKSFPDTDSSNALT